MPEVKSTTIIPIGFYCFVLGLYFSSLGFNTILDNKAGFASSDPGFWINVGALFILAAGIVAVGFGFIKVKQVCWKILFFGLSISVSCIAAFVIAFLIFIMIDAKFLAPIFSSVQISSVQWFCFLSFFLSEIIVLYYLCREEVLVSFGDMGDLVSPF